VRTALLSLIFTANADPFQPRVVEVLYEPHLLIEVILRVPKLTPNLGVAQARSCDWSGANLGPGLETPLMRESVLKGIPRSNGLCNMVGASKNEECDHVRSKGDGLLVVDAGLGNDLQVDAEARLERTIVDVGLLR
jgi:hypothetical protein